MSSDRTFFCFLDEFSQSKKLMIRAYMFVRVFCEKLFCFENSLECQNHKLA